MVAFFLGHPVQIIILVIVILKESFERNNGNSGVEKGDSGRPGAPTPL